MISLSEVEPITLRDGERPPVADPQPRPVEASPIDVRAPLPGSMAPVVSTERAPARRSRAAWAISGAAFLALAAAAAVLWMPKRPAEAQVAATPVVHESKPNQPARERVPGELPAAQAPRPGNELAEAPALAPAAVEMRSVEVRVNPPTAMLLHNGARLSGSPATVQVAPGDKKVIVAVLAGYHTRKVVVDGSSATVSVELKAETPIERPRTNVPTAPATAKLPPIEAAKTLPTEAATPKPEAPQAAPAEAAPAKPARAGGRPWEPESFSDETH